MKYFFLITALAICGAICPVSGQQVQSPFYVVIGGFKQEENARRFSAYAQEQNLPATYALHEARGIFYVYVRVTHARDVAYEILRGLRDNSLFKDAWVFHGDLAGSPQVAKDESAEREPAPVPVTVAETPQSPAEQPKEASPAVAAVEEPAAPAEAPAPAGKPFVFKLIHGETGNSVEGLVRLQESEKARQFRGFKANEKVYVPAPSNKSGRWYVVCQVVGFRMVKKPVAYQSAHEMKGASVGPGEEVIIPLELERVRKGDYIEMEGVRFYNNGALFLPGSERELDELVAMMEENPDYHIRLHGHTNGDESRDIVSKGASTDFFNPDVSNEKIHGSAKELSLLRAELVKSYLTSKGIDASRITTKGEGGRQMVFDPNGTLAAMNDRVEVEIRQD